VADNRTSVLRFKIHDHIKVALCNLSDDECCQIQEIAYQCLLDGLKFRLVKRSHLQDPRFVSKLQGNS
jgi:hypothetical protein